jgi:hypothetical protein
MIEFIVISSGKTKEQCFYFAQARYKSHNCIKAEVEGQIQAPKCFASKGFEFGHWIFYSAKTVRPAPS